MKKTALLTLIFGLLLNFASNAQVVPQDTVNKAVINGQKAVTGLAQDILTNYLQVAAQNLTSNNSNLQLKITYFALNGMDSVTKYDNANFLRTKWQRNLEFVAAAGVAKNNNFNSLQGGVNFNFWNRRDAQMQYYTDAYIKPYNEEEAILIAAVKHFTPALQAQLAPLITNFFMGLYAQGNSVKDLKSQIISAIPGILLDQSSDNDLVSYLLTQFNIEIANKANHPNGFSNEMNRRIDQMAAQEATEIITVPLNTYIHSLGKTALAYPHFLTSAQATAITQYIDQQVAANAVLHKLGANMLTDLNNKVLANYQEMVNYIGRQPLLTFNYLGSYGKGVLLSSHLFGLTYLQGTGGLKTVKLGQIKASLTDTLTGDDPTGQVRNFNRNIIAFQAGYNQVLAMQKKVSIMELNIALEQDWATSGHVYSNEYSKFYLDSYFRVRLPSTPWLKFNIKYAPKGGNVLGFFDFTYNLDSK